MSQMIMFRETGYNGKTWEVPVGEPSKCFRFPGDERLYSIDSLIEAIRKLCKEVSIVSGDQSIQDLGAPSFFDALALTGEKLPRALLSDPKPKSVGQAKISTSTGNGVSRTSVVEENVKKILKCLKKTSKPWLRKDIEKATGLTDNQVTRALKEPEFREAGKEGSSKLYEAV